MKTLILGAGGVGGYFGGRMVEAGSDVTFLVRPNRAQQLQDGLRIESPHGDAVIPVKIVTGGDAAEEGFDVLILSCKAYGLVGALEAIAPYVQKGMCIIPLLNGLSHIDITQRRFPEAVICGGTAGIAATLTAEGVVRQMHPNQTITAGLLPGQTDPNGFLRALVGEMQQASINAVLSDDILQMMWDKWAFLATLAASTCLMRGTVADILATDYGENFMTNLYDECSRTAAAEGYPPSQFPVEDYRGKLFDRSFQVAASMARDIEAGGPTEGDHIIGEMIRLAIKHGLDTPCLKIAGSMLQIYETNRD